MCAKLVQILFQFLFDKNLMYLLPPVLINLSLTASIVIVAVLLVRQLLRKAPRVYSYILWAVVAFRLICPVSFSSGFSLLNIVNAPDAETGLVSGMVEYVPVHIVHTPYPAVDLLIPALSDAVNEELPQGYEQVFGEPLKAPAAYTSWVWMFGLGIMLLWALSSYLSLHHKLRTAVLLEGSVFQSEHVGSPFILGLFRPRIYVPFGLDETTLKYVLAHERHHLKRLDHIVKAFAFALLAIHWFNPLCWLAFHLMSKDMEMSCDEKVLAQENNEKAEYSTVLLSFAANRRFPSPSPLAFGETGAKGRIKNALKWKRPKVWVTVLAAVICIAVLAACAANPKENDSAADIYSNTEGISLSVLSVSQKDTSATLTLQLENQSGNDISYGRFWGLECLTDPAWQDASRAYTTEKILLQTGESKEYSIARELPPGTYRIWKQFSFGSYPLGRLDEIEEGYVSAIFTVGEATPQTTVSGSALPEDDLLDDLTELERQLEIMQNAYQENAGNSGETEINHTQILHDLTEQGPITLTAGQFSSYRFRTNSTKILLDFERTDEPIVIRLHAVDSESPILYFSTASGDLASCSFTNLTAAQEYFISTDCAGDVTFTVSDGGGSFRVFPLS